MPALFIWFATLRYCRRTAVAVLLDPGQFALLETYSRGALAAEDLFLRKQLALLQERKARLRWADDSIRWVMATLSELFPWRDALVNGKPKPLIGFELPCGRQRQTQYVNGPAEAFAGSAWTSWSCSTSAI